MLNVLQALGRPVVAETSRAQFMTPLPKLGPLAYLHVVFRPAPQDEFARIKGIVPGPVEDMLNVHNGMFLFKAAPRASLTVYGCRKPAPLDRLGGLESVVPRDILELNPNLRSDVGIAIGSYFADNSRVVLKDSKVHREDDHGKILSGRWASVEEWLTSEIERLNKLFSTKGALLAKDLEATLPP